MPQLSAQQGACDCQRLGQGAARPPTDPTHWPHCLAVLREVDLLQALHYLMPLSCSSLRSSDGAYQVHCAAAARSLARILFKSTALFWGGKCHSQRYICSDGLETLGVAMRRCPTE